MNLVRSTATLAILLIGITSLQQWTGPVSPSAWIGSEVTTADVLAVGTSGGSEVAVSDLAAPDNVQVSLGPTGTSSSLTVTVTNFRGQQEEVAVVIGVDEVPVGCTVGTSLATAPLVAEDTLEVNVPASSSAVAEFLVSYQCQSPAQAGDIYVMKYGAEAILLADTSEPPESNNFQFATGLLHVLAIPFSEPTHELAVSFLGPPGLVTVPLFDPDGATGPLSVVVTNYRQHTESVAVVIGVDAVPAGCVVETFVSGNPSQPEDTIEFTIGPASSTKVDFVVEYVCGAPAPVRGILALTYGAEAIHLDVEDEVTERNNYQFAMGLIEIDGPVGVGGIAELPDADAAPAAGPASSGPGAGMVAAIVAALAVGLALAGAAWYARRRRAR